MYYALIFVAVLLDNPISNLLDSINNLLAEVWVSVQILLSNALLLAAGIAIFTLAIATLLLIANKFKQDRLLSKSVEEVLRLVAICMLVIVVVAVPISVITYRLEITQFITDLLGYIL